ncbi:MAG: tripartite tricarboxylate transporter TctB family protein [Alphaproteobacteria bacterium HGW-Alphaproteobacteria-4]|jgi:putative tricarboxylic transport membrane protein|nr:MAG: tripartite tricarboxylate transporter TctB family protein [Alphaproteobacteria bacterium HGW-Alphaproteobacteria-4]
MASDRIFGLVVLGVALAYIASALQIQPSFLSDPVGPKVFPLVIGAVAALAALVVLLKPDESPEWPHGRTWLHLGIALAVLVGYAYALKPLGFLLPTAVAASVVSYQISPRLQTAALTGVGLSVGLFAIFKYALGLGLIALPRAMMG